DRNVSYPLLRAAEQDDIDAFRVLTNDPATDVNTTNPEFNETALHLAMAVGNDEMAQELLTREANIFAVTNFGFTVLHYLSSNSASVPCAAQNQVPAATARFRERRDYKQCPYGCLHCGV
ncbi:hypothetical protein BC938DRAFT_473646, partial [Jimgerdemannia flammicorona]